MRKARALDGSGLVIFITPDYTRWQWFSVPAGVIEIARTPGNIEVFCSFLGL
jgi:hypothetical protein